MSLPGAEVQPISARKLCGLTCDLRNIVPILHTMKGGPREHKGKTLFVPKASGRPVGSRNKTPLNVKEILAMVYEGVGGLPAMTAWARKNPTQFYRLMVKIMPTKVTLELGNNLASRLHEARKRAGLLPPPPPMPVVEVAAVEHPPAAADPDPGDKEPADDDACE